MTRLFPASTVLDAKLPEGVVPLAAEQVGELLVHPSPSLRRGGNSELISLDLDLRRFLILTPTGYLPMEIASAGKALVAATEFGDELERGGALDSPYELAGFARYWAQRYPADCRLLPLEGNEK